MAEGTNESGSGESQLAADDGATLTKSDKAVCTQDAMENLQRALTYEAVFSTLIEHKVLAMKRDCEERSRLKRMKRKSIGRILFSRKLFGSRSRKSSSWQGIELGADQPEAGGDDGSPRRCSPLTNEPPSGAGDEIEVASMAAKLRATAETPPTGDDSLASTVSNDASGSGSKSRSGPRPAARRSLLVTAQTHGPADPAPTSSSSGDSREAPTRLSPAGAGPPASPADRSYDATSLASGYDNGGGARVNTSTMADDSITSIRDSIESLSFASSRATVSFGGTEVIPEDTASLLYERARVAKRLRILEAKSISAQCSPVLPRHVAKLLPTPLPASPLAKADPPPPGSSHVPLPTAVPIPTHTSSPLIAAPRSQVRVAGEGDTEAAALRFFSRQNTSEDSANLTVSTLLNEADSLASSKQPFSPTDRPKSKSTSLLPAEQSQPQPLHISSNISLSSRLVDGFGSRNLSPAPTQQRRPESESRTQGLPGSSSPCFTGFAATSSGAGQWQVGVPGNGVVGSGAGATDLASDAAKLLRMTSTSTGSSVAPTGCCATSKSSARDKEKQRFKPSWPSGQSGSDDEYRRRKRKYKRYHRCSDPVLVYPTPSGLQHCILSMPPSDPIQFHYNEDFVYDVQLQVESDKTDDLQEIVPSHSNRHRKHRHHKHKKRHRHKKPKILVHDLDTQVVKVIDPDDLPQRARWTIIATACLLLLMCLMLVGITLRMAPIIDDMVRQENERLMKESMERAKFAKNFTDAAALISAPLSSIPEALP